MKPTDNPWRMLYSHINIPLLGLLLVLGYKVLFVCLELCFGIARINVKQETQGQPQAGRSGTLWILDEFKPGSCPAKCI